MKKVKYLLIPIIALICCCVLLLAGCSSTTLTGISLSSNWFVNVPIGGGGIQKTFIKGSEEFVSEEHLVYDVTYVPNETTGGNYVITYGQPDEESTEQKAGTYETEFYATYIYPSTGEMFLDGYRAAYAERVNEGGFSTTNKESGAIIAYYYKTELETESVTYSFTDADGATSERTFDGDAVTTECYFLSCNDSLRPIYSRQNIQSHAPGTHDATDVDDTYFVSDREYVTYYDADGDEATTVLTLRNGDDEYESGAAEKTTVSPLDSSTVYFDMSSLEIAARAMGNLDSTLAQKIELFVQSAAEYSKTSLLEYQLVGMDGDLGDCGANVTALMEENGMYNSSYMDSDGDEVIDTVEVAVVSTGNTNGVYQTYWYTAVESTRNIGKATLLKISSDVAYGMGTLVYTLSDIVSTSWNGTTET